jgi:phage terminase large subunit
VVPEHAEQDRLDDLEKRPDQYEHVWGGDFVTVVEGAYFAKSLSQAKQRADRQRIADPLMTIRAILGHRRHGRQGRCLRDLDCPVRRDEIRVLDYYEAVGQPLATHVNGCAIEGYGKALMVLPHDGATNDKVYDVSYESALRDAGFDVRVIPNQGKGAAKMRIEAARRLFPSIWFNKDTTEPGAMRWAGITRRNRTTSATWAWT